jgi:hypothetical protein
MAITLDQIVDEVSLLPDDVSAQVIERILIRRHGGFEEGVEDAWKSETSLRVREILEGHVEGIPLEQSLEKAARHLSR